MSSSVLYNNISERRDLVPGLLRPLYLLDHVPDLGRLGGTSGISIFYISRATRPLLRIRVQGVPRCAEMRVSWVENRESALCCIDPVVSGHILRLPHLLPQILF